MNTKPPSVPADATASPTVAAFRLPSKSLTLAPPNHCGINDGALSPIERAIVAALISAIVKELQLEPQPARAPTR